MAEQEINVYELDTVITDPEDDLAVQIGEGAADGREEKWALNGGKSPAEQRKASSRSSGSTKSDDKS